MEIKSIDEYFLEINEYLLNIKNDSELSIYVFEIGFPFKWFVKSNENIECEVITTIDDVGKIYEIKPTNGDINISEVMEFIVKTIRTNEKIISMEESYEKEVKSYNEKLKSYNEKIKKEAKEFYIKIEELKEQIFDTSDESEIEILLEEINELTLEVKKREEILNNKIANFMDDAEDKIDVDEK